MKLIGVFLLYPAFALLIIGIHQVLVNGFANSYWILMLALMLLYGYQWRKTKQNTESKANQQPVAKAKTATKRKKQ